MSGVVDGDDDGIQGPKGINDVSSSYNHNVAAWSQIELFKKNESVFELGNAITSNRVVQYMHLPPRGRLQNPFSCLLSLARVRVGSASKAPLLSSCPSAKSDCCVLWFVRGTPLVGPSARGVARQ